MKKAKQAKKTTRKVVRKAKKIVRKRTPRFFSKPDPFYLDPKLIPVGWAYQWSVYVDPRSGWRAVPYSRHAHDFPKAAQSDDGFIIIKGLCLAEIPAQFVKAELINQSQKARDMMADFDAAVGREGSGKGMWIMPSSWVESYSREELAKIDAPGPNSPPVEVSVTLLMQVPGRWNDAAAYLKLSLNEYTRRRIMMERLVLGCMDPFSPEAVYEPVSLSFSPLHPAPKEI